MCKDEEENIVRRQGLPCYVPFAASSRLRTRRRERPWGVRTLVPLGLTRCSRWRHLRWWARRWWWCCCRWTRIGCGWSCGWCACPEPSGGCLCSPGDTTHRWLPGCTARCIRTGACLQQHNARTLLEDCAAFALGNLSLWNYRRPSHASSPLSKFRRAVSWRSGNTSAMMEMPLLVPDESKNHYLNHRNSVRKNNDRIGEKLQNKYHTRW
jgi:hypothetical protein